MTNLIWLELSTGLTKCNIREDDANIIRGLDDLICDLNSTQRRDLAKKAHIVKMNLCDDIVKRGDYD